VAIVVVSGNTAGFAQDIEAGQHPARSTLRIARSARPRKGCLIGSSGRSA